MCPLKVKWDDFFVFAKKYQPDIDQVDPKTYEGWSRLIILFIWECSFSCIISCFSCVPIIVSKQYLGTSFVEREGPQKHLYNITCTKVYNVHWYHIFYELLTKWIWNHFSRYFLVYENKNFPTGYGDRAKTDVPNSKRQKSQIQLLQKGNIVQIANFCKKWRSLDIRDVF